MLIQIVIPAHNEAKSITSCLEAFVQQTHRPEELVVVDDNSTDDTFQIASEFAEKHSWIRVIKKTSTSLHLPGKKVIDAFYFGFEQLSNFDLIGKFDADIVLPPCYFEKMVQHFKANPQLGMCAGLLFIEKEGEWVYEQMADKTHIRGPVKLYRKACFEKIGGLRSGVGWDTVDVLLSKYHQFETYTDPSLKVKHLRPTGHGYSTKNLTQKGEALYKMRYGLPIAKIAAFKMALQAKSARLYLQMLYGYLLAMLQQPERYVSKAEGKFIRKLRWKGILKKVMG